VWLKLAIAKPYILTSW